jgi:hypothetical protein
MVLIGVGLLLALLAYFVFTSKTDREEHDAEVSDVDEEDDPTLEVEEAEKERVPTTDSQDPDHALEASESKAEEPTKHEETPKVPISEDMESQGTESEIEEDQLDQLTTDPSHIEVATLLRDEVTGDLRIQVGNQLYTHIDQLLDSKDWDRVEGVVADLEAWFSPEESVPTVRENDAGPHPQSMVEQINSILQIKLADSENPQRAIRLIEGPGGSVRVLIGVQSYNLDEVPDQNARQLIRDAVATWEESQ